MYFDTLHDEDIFDNEKPSIYVYVYIIKNTHTQAPAFYSLSLSPSLQIKKGLKGWPHSWPFNLHVISWSNWEMVNIPSVLLHDNVTLTSVPFEHIFLKDTNME